MLKFLELDNKSKWVWIWWGILIIIFSIKIFISFGILKSIIIINKIDVIGVRKNKKNWFILEEINYCFLWFIVEELVNMIKFLIYFDNCKI